MLFRSAFSLQHNLETAAHAGAIADHLMAVGGSANSLLWTQIKSDITGKPISVPLADNATTLGAAILAGVGIGMYESFEQAVAETVKITRIHQPDPEKLSLYQQAYRVYLELSERLRGMCQQ